MTRDDMIKAVNAKQGWLLSSNSTDAEVLAAYTQLFGVPSATEKSVFDTAGIDRGFLMDILMDINNELKYRGLLATIHVYGGCAMMLTCIDTRRSWDFDFIFEGKPVSELSRIMRNVEDKYGLPSSVFDKTMGPLIAFHFNKNDTVIFEKMTNLTVRLCSPEQLLAMKLFSARMGEDSNDFDDAIELCKLLKITQSTQMRKILNTYVKSKSIETENNKPSRYKSIDIFISALEEELG